MKVQEVMTHNVRVVNAEETIQEAARIMAEIDAGVLPVGKEGKLVGMLTDRDIAIRAVAEGKGPDTKASDIMSREVKYCFDDEDVEDVCGNLGDQQIRRIPVLDRNKQLVGILSSAMSPWKPTATAWARHWQRSPVPAAPTASPACSRIKPMAPGAVLTVPAD